MSKAQKLELDRFMLRSLCQVQSTLSMSFIRSSASSTLSRNSKPPLIFIVLCAGHLRPVSDGSFSPKRN